MQFFCRTPKSEGYDTPFQKVGFAYPVVPKVTPMSVLAVPAKLTDWKDSPLR